MPAPTLDDTIEGILTDLFRKKGILERASANLDETSRLAAIVDRADETLLTPAGRIYRRANQDYQTATTAAQPHNNEGIYNAAKKKYNAKVNHVYATTVLGEFTPREIPDAQKKIAKYAKLIKVLQTELARAERTPERIATIVQQVLGLTNPTNVLGTGDVFRGAEALIGTYKEIIKKHYERDQKGYNKLVDQAVKDNNAYALASAMLINQR